MSESNDRARVKFLSLFLGGDWTNNEADFDRQNSNNFNDGR